MTMVDITMYMLLIWLVRFEIVFRCQTSVFDFKLYYYLQRLEKREIY